MGGLVRMLENMPANFPRRKQYETLLCQIATRIADLQLEDGSWYTSLMDPYASR